MKKCARHATPLIRLAPAINDQIDRDIEPSKLPAEPPVLLSAAIEIRLDDQQVQVAIGPSLAPCARSKENDVSVRSSRSETASSLLDKSLIGHGHSLGS